MSVMFYFAKIIDMVTRSVQGLMWQSFPIMSSVIDIYYWYFIFDHNNDFSLQMQISYHIFTLNHIILYLQRESITSVKVYFEYMLDKVNYLMLLLRTFLPFSYIQETQKRSYFPFSRLVLLKKKFFNVRLCVPHLYVLFFGGGVLKTFRHNNSYFWKKKCINFQMCHTCAKCSHTIS